MTRHVNLARFLWVWGKFWYPKEDFFEDFHSDISCGWLDMRSADFSMPSLNFLETFELLPKSCQPLKEKSVTKDIYLKENSWTQSFNCIKLGYDVGPADFVLSVHTIYFLMHILVAFRKLKVCVDSGCVLKCLGFLTILYCNPLLDILTFALVLYTKFLGTKDMFISKCFILVFWTIFVPHFWRCTYLILGSNRKLHTLEKLSLREGKLSHKSNQNQITKNGRSERIVLISHFWEGVIPPFHDDSLNRDNQMDS